MLRTLQKFKSLGAILNFFSRAALFASRCAAAQTISVCVASALTVKGDIDSIEAARPSKSSGRGDAVDDEALGEIFPAGAVSSVLPFISGFGVVGRSVHRRDARAPGLRTVGRHA